MSDRKLKARSVSVYWNYTSLAEIREELNDLIEKHGGEAELEVNDGYLSVEYYSPETDSEMKFRLEQQKARKESRRKQYETLKKEFEK